MFVLITYDVNITSPLGQKRLRNVAKVCKNYGIRVQNSVFATLRYQLNQIIDIRKDSLRFYSLGSNWKNKVISIGRNTGIDFTGELII